MSNHNYFIQLIDPTGGIWPDGRYEPTNYRYYVKVNFDNRGAAHHKVPDNFKDSVFPFKLLNHVMDAYRNTSGSYTHNNKVFGWVKE